MPTLAALAIPVLLAMGLLGDWRYAFNPEGGVQGPVFGAFGDPFKSMRLATGPQNGEILYTDGEDSYWDAAPTGGGGSGGGSWSTTTSQVAGRLVNYPNNATDIVAIGANSTTTAEFWFDPNTIRSVIPFSSSTAMTIGTAYLTSLFIGADTIAEYISDTAGAAFAGNTETGITVTYQDADNTVDVVCDTATASALGCLSAANWSVFNNKVSTTSIDTIGEVETLWGVSNILIENDIDASSELAAIMDDETGSAGNLVFSTLPSLAGFISTASSTIIGTTTVNSLQVGSTAIGANVMKVGLLTGLTTSNSESVGGLFNMNLSTTDALGMALYNNHTGTNRLLSLVCDAATYGGNCFHVRSDGTTSAVNIAGSPVGQGLIKAAIASGGNNDSSVFSLDASGSNAQGLFIKGNSATSTGLLNILDDGANSIFKVSGFGSTTVYKDLIVNGEFRPDDALCAVGEILKKAGLNDWDCASDLQGSGSGGIATSSAIADTEVIYGTGVGTVDSEAAFAYNASTNALTISGTTTTTNLSVTTAVSILGEYFTNFTTYVRSLFTGGRSITVASGQFDADPELYTDTKCIWFEDPTLDDDFKSIWTNKSANGVTITEMWAESDQTVALDLQVDDGSPANVNGTDITPAAGEAEDTTLSGDTSLAAGEELDLAITSTTNTPTWLSVCWTFTWDD
jgi:hypothetical protein